MAGKLAEEKLNKRKKAYEAKKVRARPTLTLTLALALSLSLSLSLTRWLTCSARPMTRRSVTGRRRGTTTSRQRVGYR